MAKERQGANDPSSLEKGLAVLRELAASDDGLTAGQLATATGLNRTTIYRLCEALERDAWAARSSEDDTTRFHVGVAAHGLAMLLTNKFDTEARLRPVIAELSQALGETVHVGTLERAEVVHVARATPPSGMSLAAPIGSREHAHCAALGKALLATLAAEALDGVYPDERLPVRTPSSIATRTALRAELERVRTAGYATDDEEGQLGIACVAAPVFTSNGRALFALSVTSVPARLDDVGLRRAVDAVRGSAALLTASFGGAPSPGWGAGAAA
jgi:DNA-binding IclR family transcriptional regulator